MALVRLAFVLAWAAASCAPARARPSAPSGRVVVAAGHLAPGLTDAERTKVLALCRATSTDASACGPGIVRDEARAPEVDLPTLAIDRLEVSQADYRACVTAGRCPRQDRAGCSYGDGSTPGASDWAVLEAADHPVVCVTFAQAEAYCAWAGGRVPTEVEWERAARGDDRRLFPWGDDWRPDALNWGDDGKVDGALLTAPVGSYPGGASPFGALDMVGNVWEWARGDSPVIRGGGFAAKPLAQRVTKRVRYDGARAYPNVGLRCVYAAP
jgi:formylglycine-generating enzyme required for sulfatase activity